MELTLEEKLKELREKYKKTGDLVKREIIIRQARALEIAKGDRVCKRLEL